MRLTHRRAGWALAAAGSFGLTLSGLAQSPVLPGQDKKAPAPVAVAPVAPSEARLVEIKVELAWLGDNATFPCQLAARKVDGSVEIGGVVPTEALRLKALEVAKKHCTLPIVDKLVILPNSALPMMSSPHDHLCKSAAEVLTKALADNGETFSFSADATGELTVSGSLKNWEEKLNVSRRLSMIPGCTSVVNNFDVKDVVADGKKYEFISADGKLRVPASAATSAVVSTPKPQPAPVAIAAPQMLPAPVVVAAPTMLPAPVVSTTAPAPAPSKGGLLASLTNRNPAPAPAQVTTSVVNKPVASNLANPPAVVATAAKPTTAPVVTTAKPTAQPVVTTVAKPTTAPASPYGGPVAAANIKPVVIATPSKPVEAPKPTGAPASPYGGSTAMAAAPVKPVQTAPVTANSGIKQVAYTAPQNNPSGIVQASYTAAPTAPKASPYGNSTPVAAQPVKPAAPVAVAQAPKPAPPAALPSNFSQAPVLKPQTATPAIKPVAAVTPLPAAPALKPVAPATQPVASAMTPTVQGQLLQKIHDLGGVALTDAKIQSTGKNECVIQVLVRSRAEAQEIGQKILKMPELAPYKVDLKVDIGQPAR